MAAPYFEDVRGNLDAADFFSIADTEEAKTIAHRDGIDLVMTCHYVYNMYMKDFAPYYYNLPNGQIVKRMPDGSVVDLSSDESFVWQLASGRVPEWLRQIPVPKSSDYSLYEIVDISK